MAKYDPSREGRDEDCPYRAMCKGLHGSSAAARKRCSIRYQDAVKNGTFKIEGKKPKKKEKSGKNDH